MSDWLTPEQIKNCTLDGNRRCNAFMRYVPFLVSLVSTSIEIPHIRNITHGAWGDDGAVAVFRDLGRVEEGGFGPATEALKDVEAERVPDMLGVFITVDRELAPPCDGRDLETLRRHPVVEEVVRRFCSCKETGRERERDVKRRTILDEHVQTESVRDELGEIHERRDAIWKRLI